METYTTPTSNGPTTGESSTTDQVKEKAREQTQQAAGQAREGVRSQVDRRSTEAGQRVGGFASDARSVGDELRKQGKDQPARLADQAADRAQQLGDYLQRSDADRILGDIEDFGRRQPWAVIGGGLALGIIASRFLKASSTRRYEQRSQSFGQLPRRTSYDAPPLPPVSRDPYTSAPQTTPPVTTPPVDVPTEPLTPPPGGSRFEGTR